MSSVPQSMYRRILGEQFDQLPAVLVSFHGESKTKHARGLFDVARGRGWIRRMAAAVAGLPPAATQVPLDLTIEPVGLGEHWTRRFGTFVFATRQQSPHKHVMLERIGLWTFQARVSVAGGRLLFEFQRAHLCGVPLPRWLGPRVDGWAEGNDERWIVDVRICAPLLGVISHYHGEVRPC